MLARNIKNHLTLRLISPNNPHICHQSLLQIIMIDDQLTSTRHVASATWVVLLHTIFSQQDVLSDPLLRALLISRLDYFNIPPTRLPALALKTAARWSEKWQTVWSAETAHVLPLLITLGWLLAAAAAAAAAARITLTSLTFDHRVAA